MHDSLLSRSAVARRVLTWRAGRATAVAPNLMPSARTRWTNLLRVGLSAFAVLALLSPQPVRAQDPATQTYQQSLPFSTQNQPVFKGLKDLTYSKELAVTWGPKDFAKSGYVAARFQVPPRIPGFCIPGFCVPLAGCTGDICTPEIPALVVDLGEFGGGVSGHTEGKGGVRFTGIISAGDVNVNSPIDLSLSYPAAGALYPGDSYTVTAHLTPGAATLDTTPPTAAAEFDLILKTKTDVRLQVKTFGKDIIDVHPSVNIDQDFPIFKLTAEDIANKQAQKLADKFNAKFGEFANLSLSLGLNPSSGTADAGSTSVSAQVDTPDIAKLSIDVTAIALRLTAQPPFSQEESVDLHYKDKNFGSLTEGTKFLDLTNDIGLAGHQEFSFTPKPTVSFQVPGGQLVTLHDGESQTLTFPTVPDATAMTNDQTFQFLVHMDNDFRNKTQALLTNKVNFLPLELNGSGSVFGHDLGSFAFQPIDPINLLSVSVPVFTYQKTFTLGGFTDATPAPFTLVGFVYPTPVLTGLTPGAVQAGQGALTITVTGSNFVAAHGTNPGTTILFNGAPRVTTFVSATTVTAAIPASDLTSAGLINITALNPAPGGGLSGSLSFNVDGTLPIATVKLNTTTPKTNDTLTATATKADASGSPVTLTFVWKNGSKVVKTTSNTTALTDTLDLSVAGNGNKGDVITVTVTPTAGILTGSPAADSATVANTAPVATNKRVTLKQDTTLNSSLTASDVDSADTLTFSKVTDPSHGKVTVNADGTYTYTPTASYVGNDSFTAKANDGTADSNVATVTINVGQVNHAPTATVALNTNSPKTDDTLTATATTADREGDTVTLTYVWKNGNTVVKTTSNTAALTDTLDLGVAGNGDKGDVITVTVTPNDGSLNGTPVSATATVVNAAPVANAQSVTVIVGSTYKGTLTASDADTDPLTYSKVSDPSHGTVTVNADGTFSYTPTAGSNSAGDSFTFKANDGTADSNVATVTITLDNPPVVATNTGLTVNNGATATITSSNLNTTDADNDPVTYTVTTAPAHGTLKLNNVALSGTFTQADINNGALKYTQDGTPVMSDSFAFSAADGRGGSVTGTFNIIINEAPSLIVTTTSDTSTATDGQTSLREAIAYANSGNAGNSPQISFKSGLFGTITLGGTELAISHDVTITGPGAETIAVDGNNTSRVFNILKGTVTLFGLGIYNGNSSGGSGGGISNTSSGTVTVDNCVLLSNHTAGFGGGIFNDGGTMIVKNSTLVANSSVNQGGGIINYASTAFTQMTLTNCTLHQNSANDAGAIMNFAIAHSASMTLNNCTVANNAATAGPDGGILNYNNLPNSAVLDINNTIISSNSGNNFNNNDGYYNQATLNDGGYNLSSDATGPNNGTNDQINTDPKLGQYYYNYGLTPTLALLSGSPAIDAGNSTLTTDQTGRPRPVITSGRIVSGGNGSDIGAYEDQTYGASKATTNGLSTAKASVPNSVRLNFLVALDADSAGDAAHYTVRVNGVVKAVESAGYNAKTHAVTLSLADGTLKVKSKVVVTWSGLLNAKGKALSGSSGTLIAH